jgi:hypothetical protein
MNVYNAIEAKYGFTVPAAYRRIEAEGSFKSSTTFPKTGSTNYDHWHMLHSSTGQSASWRSGC